MVVSRDRVSGCPFIFVERMKPVKVALRSISCRSAGGGESAGWVHSVCYD